RGHNGARLHSSITKITPPAAVTAAKPSPLSLCPSTDLARDVVEEGHTHQQDEQRDAHLLTEGLRPIRSRAALEPLGQLKHDLSAVEDRDGQQIQEAERQRDEHEEAQER